MGNRAESNIVKYPLTGVRESDPWRATMKSARSPFVRSDGTRSRMKTLRESYCSG